MSYTIQLKKSALKDLYKLPKEVSRQIAQAINDLGQTPRPHGCKKLKGLENLYRIRIGDYRIVYQMNDKILLILVVLIGNRKEVYRNL